MTTISAVREQLEREQLPSDQPGSDQLPDDHLVVDQLPSVSVGWTEDGTVLELTGRMTRQLLDHARDLVLAQVRPTTCLTIRVRGTVLTRDLLTMLSGVRRHLARVDSSLRIDDPHDELGLKSDVDGRLLPLRRIG